MLVMAPDILQVSPYFFLLDCASLLILNLIHNFDHELVDYMEYFVCRYWFCFWCHLWALLVGLKGWFGRWCDIRGSWKHEMRNKSLLGISASNLLRIGNDRFFRPDYFFFLWVFFCSSIFLEHIVFWFLLCTHSFWHKICSVKRKSRHHVFSFDYS